MSTISIKESNISEESRKFVDKKTNKRYWGPDVVWVIVKNDGKIVHNGYFVKATRTTDNIADWTRVEPTFKKVKYRVPTVTHETIDIKSKGL